MKITDKNGGRAAIAVVAGSFEADTNRAGKAEASWTCASATENVRYDRIDMV